MPRREETRIKLDTSKPLLVGELIGELLNLPGDAELTVLTTLGGRPRMLILRSQE